MKRLVLILLMMVACSQGGNDSSHESDAGRTNSSLTLTREQVQLGCLPMGEGDEAHVMCNHGHSLSFRSENLYARWQVLQARGATSISEADLMAVGGENNLPEPLTPLLRASVGERVKIRAISYGPEMHDFHVHGHVWMENSTAVDTHALMPAQVFDGAEFFAGAGATSSTERGGPGDWMYHCHVETHATSGMWGTFRVTSAGDTAGIAENGRYPTELPEPLGGDGQTIDVYVVAAAVPLTVTREFDTMSSALQPVDRLARIYVPIADEATFQQATVTSIQELMRPKKESWLPWTLVLRLGTTVRVHLRNLISDAPVSLHPHGVRYDIENDGTMPESVAWFGGTDVVSQWTADTPGTWPMHDHARTLENIGRGLFGALVVKTPDEEARLDRDYLVYFHDFDMNWMMGMPDNMMPSQHPH